MSKSNIKVPLLDLRAQYLSIKDQIDEALANVLYSGAFIMGPNVEAFEKEIAEYIGVRHAIGVANGSDALHLSLMALGVGPGDEVIVPAFTFFATAGAVARAGATPVFVDIDPRTFNIDPFLIEERITERTRAIIPVHLYGQPADMDPILDLARRHDLFVVEDAAQAIGANYKGRNVGTLGDTACFSFFPTKNLGAFGDGGMVVTNSDEVAGRLRLLRVHGSRVKYHHELPGYNSRLDEIQAAILRIKLMHLEEWTEARVRQARAYDQALGGCLTGLVDTPSVAQGTRHVYHQYTIKTQERDQLQRFLSDQGIGTAIYYPLPLHLQPVFSDLGYSRGCLPVAEESSATALSLPIYPEMSPASLSAVQETISAYFAGSGE